MTEQDNEMQAPLRVRSLDHLQQNRIGWQGRAFEVFVNDDHSIVVSLELKQHVLLEQTQVHFVSHVDELRHDDLLILLMIDADQRGVVAEIEKSAILFLFHNLEKSVFGNVEAQAGIEIAINSPRFLDQIDTSLDPAFARTKKKRCFFSDKIGFIGVQDRLVKSHPA